MTEFDRMAAGRVIRRLRRERKQSQELLSGPASIARSHLAMIETGAKQPNFETVWRIANALQLPPHSLVALIEVEAENPQIEQSSG